MEECSDHEELFRDPVGRWMPTGNGLFWCHSTTLCGMAVWGRPGPAETLVLLRILEGYRRLAPRFDVLQDASAVDAIDLEALAVLLAWIREHEHVLRDHVRTRIAVIPPGVAGLALASIAPALALGAPVSIVTDVRHAFETLLPDGAAALHDDVQRLIAATRGVTPIVLALRRALGEARGDLDLPMVARQLGTSVRSLQRQLAEAGVTFRIEQADARFRAAQEFLRTDEKLAAVASRVGLSEDGLNELVRARTGMTSGELRRRLRGAA
jgi:AraC-like DNA-binding protein